MSTETPASSPRRIRLVMPQLLLGGVGDALALWLLFRGAHWNLRQPERMEETALAEVDERLAAAEQALEQSFELHESLDAPLTAAEATNLHILFVRMARRAFAYADLIARRLTLLGGTAPQSPAALLDACGLTEASQPPQSPRGHLVAAVAALEEAVLRLMRLREAAEGVGDWLTRELIDRLLPEYRADQSAMSTWIERVSERKRM